MGSTPYVLGRMTSLVSPFTASLLPGWCLTWLPTTNRASISSCKRAVHQQTLSTLTGQKKLNGQLQLSIPTAALKPAHAQIPGTAPTCTESTVSLTTHRMSNREMMGSVRSTFSENVSDGSYRPPGSHRQSKSNRLQGCSFGGRTDLQYITEDFSARLICAPD